MEPLIRLLPDHIANQIAAGEVVQRPASVVKELLENAIDAGATMVSLVIRDAGKALVQVIDNGCGMSVHDARMSFERHATSKIRKAEDLFNIRTMGFRGEAMASIAAVAQVQMKTRLHDAELGTEIVIEASEIKKQESVMTPPGTSILVKNLFFNIPARRNFLKSNPVETRHILNEFTHVAMANPEVAMSLTHNDQTVYDLKATDVESRVTAIMGREYDGELIPVEEETPYIHISGFIGTPEISKKKRGEQFFFVNTRFIKSPYLHHAVTSAFEGLIPADSHPFYAIFIDIDPKHIDINIHPTKTEIKFDDERTVYQLLHSVIRKSIGEHHHAPVIETPEGAQFQHLLNKVESPHNELTIGNKQSSWPKSVGALPKTSWDQFMKPDFLEKQRIKEAQAQPAFLFGDEEKKEEKTHGLRVPEGSLNLLGTRYIVTQDHEGLLIIDFPHAHQRILYEKFLRSGKASPMASQQLLFPRTIGFSKKDMAFVREIEQDLRFLGFDLREFGTGDYILHGIPAELRGSKAEHFFEEIIANVIESGGSNAKEKLYERLAVSIAMISAVRPSAKIDLLEMRSIVADLFQCEHPGVNPKGKPVFYRLGMQELESFFKTN